jgi:UDP-N-acetylmuramyl tripeptide synthase
MLNFLLISGGKLLSIFAQKFNLGNGSTWPGHIALGINPHFVGDLLSGTRVKTIFIAGTNGKTTTAALIRTVLEANKKRVIQNQSGANLLNGIASTLLLETNILGKLEHDYALFEVDENTLPLLLHQVRPDYVILTNLFRDQLDRYGEVDSIVQKWRQSLRQLDKTSTLILNADDPQIAYLGNDLRAQTVYFGLDGQKEGTQLEHAADSIYCPSCGKKLVYERIVFSHLGNWRCLSCHLHRPAVSLSTSSYFPLAGTYNQYNTLAAILLLKELGLSQERIREGLELFRPAFGRQETILFEGKQLQVFLSKNPTGFNESLRTIRELGAKSVLLALNDRVADGKDVSWIWDIDIDEFVGKFETIIISGDRAYDLALRVKYTEKSVPFRVIGNLADALAEGLSHVGAGGTLYVLPTYTAMLEVRKILTGRKIL